MRKDLVQLGACYRGYVIICVLRPYIDGGIVGYNWSDGARKQYYKKPLSTEA